MSPFTYKAETIGYHPQDDAEVFADKLIAEHGEPDLTDPVMRRIGGQWCDVPLGEPYLLPAPSQPSR